MGHDNRQIATAARLAARSLVGSAAFLLVACAPPLLSPDEPRSQFDRYDAVRNRRADQFIFDDYGRKRPNLQQRLSPRD